MPRNPFTRGNREPRSRDRGNAYEPVVGFQSSKAVQIAAYFIGRAGGTIEKLKLAKLAYLSEREHLRAYDAPITYDELYSLPHGPICSSALNGIDGKLQGHPEWNKVHAHGLDRVVGPPRVNRDDLDELSDAEIRVLENVWIEHGGKTANQLRAWTHVQANVPEYTEVGEGRRLPISYLEVLRALGKTDEIAAQAEREIAAFRQIANVFDR